MKPWLYLPETFNHLIIPAHAVTSDFIPHSAAPSLQWWIPFILNTGNLLLPFIFSLLNNYQSWKASASWSKWSLIFFQEFGKGLYQKHLENMNIRYRHTRSYISSCSFKPLTALQDTQDLNCLQKIIPHFLLLIMFLYAFLPFACTVLPHNFPAQIHNFMLKSCI